MHFYTKLSGMVLVGLMLGLAIGSTWSKSNVDAGELSQDQLRSLDISDQHADQTLDLSTERQPLSQLELEAQLTQIADGIREMMQSDDPRTSSWIGWMENISAWSADELQRGLALILENEQEAKERDILVMILLNRWCKIDGLAAIEYSLALPEASRKMLPLEAFFKTWAQADPYALSAWYEENKDLHDLAHLHDKSIGQVLFTQLAKRDLAGTFKSVDWDDLQQSNAAQSLCYEMSLNGEKRSELLSLVQGLEDEDTKNELLDDLIISTSNISLAEAQLLLDEMNLSDTEHVAKYQYYMAKCAASWRAEKSMAVAMDIEEGEYRDKAVSSCFSHMAMQQPEAAQSWLEKHGDDFNRDDLLEQAVNRHSEDPQLSLNWAMQMENDERRTKSTAKYYKRWADEHQLGASKWLEQQDEDTQAAILAALADQ